MGGSAALPQAKGLDGHEPDEEEEQQHVKVRQQSTQEHLLLSFEKGLLLQGRKQIALWPV